MDPELARLAREEEEKVNMAKALSREVQRVATLRERYNSAQDHPQINAAPVIMMMDMALEKAHIAAGSNDATQVIQAYKNMQGFEE